MVMIGKKLFFVFLALAALNLQASMPRERINLDRGWRFHLGHAANPEKDFNFSLVSIFAKTGKAEGTAIDPRFDDSHWQKVDIPHDWVVELPFVNHPSFDVMSHGYKPVGGFFPETSIGWYRRSFDLNPSDSLKRISLTFDGVFRDARFWLNGFYLGRNESGYIGVEYDVTDYVYFDRPNVITVRVDATQYEGWFYEGAGIYRHVWLNKYDPVYIPAEGTFIFAEMKGDNAVLHWETEVKNSSHQDEGATLITRLLTRDGVKVAEKTTPLGKIPKGKSIVVKNHFLVKKPRLWSLEDPYLYRVVQEVVAGGRLADRRVVRTGFRSLEWSPEKGFLLNGKQVKIKGVNMHQDHAGVGVALPDGLISYRVHLIKRMGANAWRTSHNPPAPELLDICDSLGVLVLDETRLLNSSPEYLDQFRRMILRDRNHPSVILWSIGNEEGWVQTTSTGKKIAATLLALQQSLDPSRTSTYAADLPNVFKGINEIIPIRSFNYREKHMEAYHRDHPYQPILGTEMGSTVTTRGIYVTDSVNCYLPDHDLTAPWWASRAEEWWPIAAENDWMAGGFIWTGLDYRGEPTPFHWPNISSHFGVMDLCGFPKNLYYYYQSWWNEGSDVLHISPHWNWPLHQWNKKEVEVWINTNADSVKLKLNGKDLGASKIEPNRHLRRKVPYEPGTLEAIGYRQGREIRRKVETTGPAFELVVIPHKTTALADGKDIVVMNIHAIDSGGRIVPTANNKVQFRISGPGRIIGVSNGDPSSHEPDKCPEGKWQRSLFNGWCQVIVEMGDEPGVIKFDALSESLWPGGTEIHTVDPKTGGSLPAPVKVTSTHKLNSEPFMNGADISFLPQLEEEGIKFYDYGSQQSENAFDILKRYGFNYVRLRIFYDPSQPQGYAPGKGYCNLSQTLAMAQRIKAAGMKFLLDFHYSDFWADPGKQYTPATWKGLPYVVLKDSVYSYTRRVLLALKAQGTLPDMVQPGNEINHGMLWPEGHVSRPDQLAGLLKSGIDAVKSVSPKIAIMLHLALGGQNEESVWWFDQMFSRGVDCDVIGLSYYPRWHGTLDELDYNMRDLIRRYQKDVVVVEYSHLKREVYDLVKALPDGKGKGIFIWEPLNTWERIFKWDGRPTRHLRTYQHFK
jgi:beta-galactosidase